MFLLSSNNRSLSLSTENGSYTVSFRPKCQKAKEKNLDINEYYFRYKGPIPQSKETAILMLADGCEAALRAMNINVSDKEALKTISNIIYSRKKDGQLDDSNLSKGEIFLIKRSFLNVWKRIRHRRIQYPTNKNNTFS